MHAFNVPAAYTMAASQADASRDSAGVVFTLIIGAGIILNVFWLWSLIDALSWPVTTWDRAELSKARWVMRIVFLGAIGAVLYLTSPRRALRATYVATRWGGVENSQVPRQGRASND